MRGELWDGDPSPSDQRREPGRDVLVFLPGTAEITLLGTTLEFLIKAGYITGVKVYKINARVDQETLDELKRWPDAYKWKENYANEMKWERVVEDLRAPEDHVKYLDRNFRKYQPRRILLSTEAVNAGITLPKLAWVISSMGVRRVYYDPRREIRVNVLAPQTKASAVQEGGRCGRVFAGQHLILATQGEMNEQYMIDDPPGIETTKLDGLYLRLLKDLPRSIVEELPWMEPVNEKDLEVVYDRLMTLSMLTPGLAHSPPGVLSQGMEMDPEQ
eukprot:6469153-Amphidinium_carterae.1